MENNGVRFVQQQAVRRGFTVGPLAAGTLERSRPESEVVRCASVVLIPEQNDFRLAFRLVERALFKTNHLLSKHEAHELNL